VDIKQRGKNYQKWMSQPKAIQSKCRNEAIANMDKKNCSMYRSKMMEEGIDVMVDASQQETVDAHDSDEEKECIDLDTIGLAAGI